MSRSEYLSQDILDESFVKCFSTIHAAQMLLGCARVDITHRFVTPPCKAQKVCTSIWICTTFIAMYLLSSFYYDMYYNKSFILFFTFAVGFALLYMIYLVNMIQSKFCNGEKHVQLYLMLQKVDRHFRTLTEFKIVHNNQHFFNFISVLIVMILFPCGFCYYIFNTEFLPNFTLILSGAFVTLHIDLILTISLIYFLGARLRILNKIIEVDGFYDTGNKVLSFRNVSRIEDGKNFMGLEEIKTCLWKILKGYSFTTELFQLQVFTLVSAAFLYALLGIEAVVIGLQTQTVPVLAMISIGLWLFLYTLQVVVLVMVNHWFAMKVDATKAICVHALSIVHEGPVYKTAKGIVRLIETDQHIFSVYGVFEVNQSLPLVMLGLLTSNLVVLLQFTM